MPPHRTPLIFGVGGLHRIARVSGRQRLLRQAFDVGFRSFDVAPAYGNGLGEVELGRIFMDEERTLSSTLEFWYIPARTDGGARSGRRRAAASSRRSPAAMA